MDNRRERERDWDYTLRDRVREAEIAPSRDLWGDIEQSLEGAVGAMKSVESESIGGVEPTPQISPRPRYLREWLGGVAAVAAAVLIAMLFIDAPSEAMDAESIANEMHNIIAEAEAEAKAVTETEVETEGTEGTEERAEREVTNKQENNIEQLAVATLQIEDDDEKSQGAREVYEREDVDEEREGERDEREVIGNRDDRGEVREIIDEKSEPRQMRERAYTESYTREREGNNTSLALSGAGGLMAMSTNDIIPIRPVATAYDVLGDPDDCDEELRSANTNADITHHQPLSIGLRVQHDLSPRFRLGSGLNYTRLISDIKGGSGSSSSDKRQEIHFIGVPIRLDYQFIKIKDFSLYVGAGGAVEYCVGATLDGKKLEEKAWHYSTNLALGAEYKINRWLGFYFEPEMSYYITETELYSIRNDSPTTFTLRLGVSFTM